MFIYGLGLIFMLLASPKAFQVVRSVLGGWISSAEGLPKIGGLFVHALVLLVLYTVIQRTSTFATTSIKGALKQQKARAKEHAAKLKTEQDARTLRQKASQAYNDAGDASPDCKFVAENVNKLVSPEWKAARDRCVSAREAAGRAIDPKFGNY
jgi:hypothetical protein